MLAVGLGGARQESHGAGGAGAGGTTYADGLLTAAARYTVWFHRGWAFDGSIALPGSDGDGAVVPLLAGLTWYPTLHPAPDVAVRAGPPGVRPYLAGSLGLFVHRVRQRDARTGAERGAAYTDAVPGGRLGIGVDVLAGERLVLGAFVGQQGSTIFGTAPDGGTGSGTAVRVRGPVFLVTGGVRFPNP